MLHLRARRHRAREHDDFGVGAVACRAFYLLSGFRRRRARIIERSWGSQLAWSWTPDDREQQKCDEAYRGHEPRPGASEVSKTGEHETTSRPVVDK
jgi:hypothetical protein